MWSDFSVHFYFLQEGATPSDTRNLHEEIIDQFWNFGWKIITTPQGAVHRLLGASIYLSCRHFHQLSNQAHPSLLQLHTQDISSTLSQIYKKTTEAIKYKHFAINVITINRRREIWKCYKFTFHLLQLEARALLPCEQHTFLP